jgi:protein gp37
MSDNSSIQWCDASWVTITGCTRASAGCDNCYSAALTHRLDAMGQEKYRGLTVLNKRGDRHFNGVVKCWEESLSVPLKWKRPRRIFVNSMSDTFHRDVPFSFTDKIFAVAALCPQHTFQILTKRPRRMSEYLSNRMFPVCSAASQLKADLHPVDIFKRFKYPFVSDSTWPLPNVWLGTSVENQAAADERIPHILNCPAAVRFLSIEPQLEEINLPRTAEGGIDWVIIGGESGPRARPFNPAWAAKLINQCGDYNIAVFVKQFGANPIGMNLRDSHGGDMEEWPEELRIREFPKSNS